MHTDHGAVLKVKKLNQNAILQLGGDDLQKGHCSVLLSHAKGAPFPKLKAAGGNKILGGKSRRREPVPVESKPLISIHVEDAVHEFEPFLSIQGACGNAHALEVQPDVILDALQTVLGKLWVIRFNAEGEILGFHQTVVALAELDFQHLRIFAADAVEVIPLGFDVDAILKTVRSCCGIEEGELEVDGRIEVV